MRGLLRWAAVPALAVLALAVAPAASAGTAVLTPMQTEVQQVALHTKDVPGYQVVLDRSTGDSVAGTITLWNCAYRFTTEKYRVARHQTILFTTAGKYTGISNEVVAYDTAAHAQQALKEWRASVVGCTRTKNAPPLVAGDPGYTFLAEKKPVVGSSSLPIKANVVSSATYITKFNGAKHNFVAYLQLRGKVLDIMWCATAAPATAAQLKTFVRLASITGRKLAAY